MQTLHCKACDKRDSDLHPEYHICFECFKNHKQPKEMSVMNAQYKVDLIKKIDGFAKYIRATVHLKKRIRNGLEFSNFILDNGFILIQFSMGEEYFQITAYDKVNIKTLHRSQSKLYDLDSITYDYETLTEILNVLEYV